MTSVSYPRTRYAINENRPSQSCNFFEVDNLRSDMTCTLVSCSPPLKILPMEYMEVLESN